MSFSAEIGKHNGEGIGGNEDKETYSFLLILLYLLSLAFALFFLYAYIPLSLLLQRPTSGRVAHHIDLLEMHSEAVTVSL